MATENEDAVPGYRNYLICCDESGMHGSQYYGFGSLWMPWERRGDFAAMLTELQAKYRYRDEMKWSRIRERNEPFFSAMVQAFFRTRWLMFHCLVVRKAYVDTALHGEDPHDLARRKQFSMLIQKKIEFFAGRDAKKAYLVWVDRLPSRYAKADEAAEKIVKYSLERALGNSPLRRIATKDSRETPGIQLADLLLGAVVTAWNNEGSAAAKTRMRALVARHLGWVDLRADTRPQEWKFNIWHFWDPTEKGERECETRPVRHLLPTPAYKGTSTRRPSGRRPA